MKRHIVAIALAVLAAPALALEVGAPYEKSQFDRQLPNIDVAPSAADARPQFAAAAGSTRSDVEISTSQAVDRTTGSGLATGPWANDHHFIAPAQ
ncbi:MAG TPA: hypothetical protein VFZ84_08545 [Burkholderiales bacterium]